MEATTREYNLPSDFVQGDPTDPEVILAHDISQFYDDPLGFVLYNYPWGEPGTELEEETGPDVWQAMQLIRIGKAIKDDPSGYQIQEAISSGHGVGKSCEVAWLIDWATSTRPHIQAVITANTDTQLRTKTWKELAKWHKLSRNKHWFKWTATRFTHVDHPETWYAAAIPNSETNSESFAGNHGTHVMVLFDEASAIPDKIWEVTEGAMTTPRSMWFCYGNPTLNTGRFRECFGEYSHRWTTQKVDSRTCKKVEKKKIQEWLEDHGEDSDFFRVRVRGEFPRLGTTQLISSSDVERAANRRMELHEYTHMPVVIGVDVARFGGDETVITIRQGPKVFDQQVFRGLRNTQVATKAANVWRTYRQMGLMMAPIMVDGIGLGSGVVDILHDSGYPVCDINVGENADDEKVYANRKAEGCFRMKAWFEGDIDIPDEAILRRQLISIHYDHDMKERVRIEGKAKVKDILKESPDRMESLMLTFVEVVNEFALTGGVGGLGGQSFEPSWEC